MDASTIGAGRPKGESRVGGLRKFSTDIRRETFPLGGAGVLNSKCWA